MTATLIKRGERVRIVEKNRVFEWESEPGSGFSFDIDEAGEIVVTDGNRANVERCLSGEPGLIDLGVRVVSDREIVEPSEWRCACGSRILLGGTGGWHDEECTSCGRWYNASGQELDRHAMVCSLYAQGIDCMCGEGDR